jgi:DnaJ-domain-containing protein 1
MQLSLTGRSRSTKIAGGEGADRQRVDRARQLLGQREALAEMELTAAADLKEIKTRYKQLVKRWHPDVNGGDPQAAERFKAIAQAYGYLVSSGYH